MRIISIQLKWKTPMFSAVISVLTSKYGGNRYLLCHQAGKTENG
jgi:hypothetical protein